MLHSTALTVKISSLPDHQSLFQHRERLTAPSQHPLALRFAFLQLPTPAVAEVHEPCPERREEDESLSKDLNKLVKWELNGREIKKLGQDCSQLVYHQEHRDESGETGIWYQKHSSSG